MGRRKWVTLMTLTLLVASRSRAEEDKPTFDFGAYIGLDGVYTQPDDALQSRAQFENGVEFRWIRLSLKGVLTRHVKVNLTYDTLGRQLSDTDFKPGRMVDAYFTFTDLIDAPVAIRVGRFKQPFSLAQLTSARKLLFMERPLPDVFAPSRETGVMVSGNPLDGDLWWGVSAYIDGDFFGEKDAQTIRGNAAARAAYRFALGDEQELQLGLSSAWRNPDETLRFRTRAEEHLSNRILDTGSLLADDALQFGADAAYRHGPFLIAAEYNQASVNAPDGSPEPLLNGFYVEGSYFINGHRRFKKGAINSPSLAEQLNTETGTWGALEIAARYSQVDLSDELAGAKAGNATNYGLGMNYYLSSYTRIMFNYIHTDVDYETSEDGEADIFMTRVQVSW